ncbi:MAG: MSCRAMM family protein [Planctomycetota bacterium]|jgi:hypothetical protein
MQTKLMILAICLCVGVVGFAVGIATQDSDKAHPREAVELPVAPAPQPVVASTPPPRRPVGGASLEGVVLDADTRAPIAGVDMELQEPKYDRRVTGADGRFRFEGLPSGKGRLLPKKDGYVMEFLDLGELASHDSRALEVVLERASVLHLHVTGADGKPVTGRIWLRMGVSQGVGEMRTLGTQVDLDENGYVAYTKIAPGEYSLSVSREGAQSEEQTVEVGRGETTVRFTLR